MSRKTILMLGGSAQQVVAIEAARKLGYRTVVCDFLPDNPGQHAADVFYLESTTDKEKMLEIARKEQVDGVIAYSSDPAAPTAAYVASALGLPTNPPEAIRTMSYKHLFRKHLQEHGLPCPQSFEFSPEEPTESVCVALQNFSWPIVVKPTDSSGSKGVTVIKRQEELADAISYASKFSRNHTLIAEEYIRNTFPHVIGGDIFVLDGKVQFWGLMSCLRDTRNDLVPCGEMAPHGLTDHQLQRVMDVLSRLVSSLDIRFGELNVEVLIGDDDVPYVLELASRAGGNMIPIELSDMSNMDLVSANINCAMGVSPGNLSFNSVHAKPHLTYVLHSDKAGIYKGVNISEQAKKCIYRICPYTQEGDEVSVFDGANKALGIIFARFDTVSELRRFVNKIENYISPIVDPL